jgi:hypothetical protein
MKYLSAVVIISFLATNCRGSYILSSVTKPTNMQLPVTSASTSVFTSSPKSYQTSSFGESSGSYIFKGMTKASQSTSTSAQSKLSSSSSKWNLESKTISSMPMIDYRIPSQYPATATKHSSTDKLLPASSSCSGGSPSRMTPAPTYDLVGKGGLLNNVKDTLLRAGKTALADNASTVSNRSAPILRHSNLDKSPTDLGKVSHAGHHHTKVNHFNGVRKHNGTRNRLKKVRK